jgi:2-polyprenyl-6-methoxyphenol hydroxylase-like FAD-dependent oxidoreductase
VSRPEEVDVLIAGAGVGGAALALALGHAHPLKILVVDRRSGPGNVNRGDSLLPAVTRHLGTWGALEAIRAAGARAVAKMQVFHDGVRLYEAPLEAPGSGAPYLVLPHPEIERVLVESSRATGRVDVRYRTRLLRLVEEQGRVCGAILAGEDGEHEVRASLVVGADGSSSTVRSALDVALPTAAYDHGFYILDVDRPAGYEDAMRVELHPRGGVLVVPQGTDRVGLGVLVRADEMALFRAGTLEEKLAAIAERSPLLVGRRPHPDGAHLYRLVRGHARHYVARGAALLGDAVHVTNPTVGQGMTMAVEDAAALARHVGAALADGLRRPVLDPLLHEYERERRPRNERLIRWSHWLSRFYALGEPFGHPLRRNLFRVGGLPVGRTIHRYLWSRMATREAA